MNMNEFNNNTNIKFLIVLGKMQNSIFTHLNKHMKELGINTTEFLVLYAIAANGPLTIQDIAARITVTSGNMTYTVDKLVKSDYVKRVRCEEDRRKIFIDFTDKGNDKWKQVMAEHTQFMDEFFGIFDEELMKETIDNMKAIGKGLSKHD